jgi:hypothetical protein
MSPSKPSRSSKPEPPSKPSSTRSANFPRRDADGRIAQLPDMLGGVLFYMVVGTIVLVAIDGIVSLLGIGPFGHVSGWLAGILLVFMFVEDFRSWKGAPLRIAVAFVGAALGVLAGSALGARIDSLPAVFAGAISVTVAGLIYALVWFFGIRFVVSRLGER